MNYFFAVFGPQTQRAFTKISFALQTFSKLRCVNVVASSSCLMGETTTDTTRNETAPHPKTETQLKTSNSLLLDSRLSQKGFLASNSEQFDCKSVSELAHLFESTSDLKSFTGELQGDFRYLWANPNAYSLTIAISPFNPQTLFYAEIPECKDTYLICSDLSPFLNLLEPKADTVSLAMWLSGRPDPNRSMYSNIHQLPQASMLTFSLGALGSNSESPLVTLKTERFWDIQTNVAGTDCKDQKTQLRQLIQTSVSRCIKQSLEDDGNQALAPIFTQLSGGMDSTSVSATAFNLMPSGNKNLHSISHTYANTQSCDESDNIQAMISRYPFAKSHFIELDKYTELSFAQLYPTHPQSPGMVLSPKYHEEAKLLKACGAKTMLTGNGGDEMFWGHSFAYYDRLKTADLRVVGEVIKGARELNVSVLRALRSVFISPLVHYDILPMLAFATQYKKQANTLHQAQQAESALTQKLVARNMHLPSWLTVKASELVSAQQFENAKRNPFLSGKHGLTRYARYDGLFNSSTFNSMRSYQAVFDQYGLNLQHPLFDKQIAEFSFAIAQHLQISGKYPKLLLRQAMTEDLPEQVCWNSHKTVFDQHFAKLVQQNEQSLRELLKHEGLQDLGLLDNTALLKSFDELVQDPHPSLNVDLLYAILVQSWYQTHILKQEA
jgi:asparagine synthetase B (glutamine-hydrolysing)